MSHLSSNMQDVATHKVAKLVLLGDSGVGKSSLLTRFVHNKFFDKSEPTIGAAFTNKCVPVDRYLVKFEIWDTAGAERFRSLTPMYYREAAAALIVYDVTSRSSFECAKRWLSELYMNASNDLVVALIGNKVDLPDHAVDFQEGKRYADEQGLLFAETSAKNSHRVNEIFNDVARKLIEKAPSTLKDGEPKEPEVLLSQAPPPAAPQDACPC